MVKLEVLSKEALSDAALGEINLLLSQLKRGNVSQERAFLESVVSNEANKVLVARGPHDEIIGMLTLIIILIPSVKKAFIEDVCVREDFRKNGIASALIKKAIETAEKEKVHYVDLTSRPIKSEANGLYQSLGFELRETNCYRYRIAD